MTRDALVVGINAYQNLANLQAAGGDSEAVAQCLEHYGECRVRRCPEMIQDQRATVNPKGQVTTAMLEQALIDLFKPAGTQVPQTAIFYYSGHGLQRHAGIAEGYLATSDSNPQQGHYGLSLNWLRRLLDASPVRQRVIWLDCCHSGELLNYLEADPGAREGVDRLFMAASRDYEAAYESLDSSHSVFTQALLFSLDPHETPEGKIGSHRLCSLVNDRMRGELQQPLFESSGSEIVLTRCPEASPSVCPPLDDDLVTRIQRWSYNFCPFPGLEAFSHRHHPFFFGRRALLQQLWRLVQRAPLCLVHGPTGSGKTSLLRAGLGLELANPRPGARGQGAAATVHYLDPGNAPLQQLAELFIAAGASPLERATQIEQVQGFLQRGATGLAQLVRAMDPPRPLVLVLDQFEQMFPPQPSAALRAERDQLVACMMAGYVDPTLPLTVVLGLGSAGLSHLREYPELVAAIGPHHLAVSPLAYEELKTAITGPLEQVGLAWDPNLIYTLLLDLAGSPAELPLLQLILRQLWQQRQQVADAPPMLTLETYTHLGGLRYLLRQRATAIYHGLSAEEQAVAQRIFLSLCCLEAEGNQRRRVSHSELVTPDTPLALLERVLGRLLGSGLVVAHGSPAAEHDDPTQPHRPLASILGEPSYEIAHESLVQSWPLLLQWREQLGAGLRQRRWLEQAAQAWHYSGGGGAYALRGERLTTALDLQRRQPAQLSERALSYVKASAQLARRQQIRRYGLRLLVPLSMAAGMLMAYSFDRWQQGGTGQQLPMINLGQPQLVIPNPLTAQGRGP